MILVSLSKAKVQLPKLIEYALRGEEVVIARRGKPAVRLTPMPAPKSRQFGALKGVISINKSFFEPLPPGEAAAWITE